MVHDADEHLANVKARGDQLTDVSYLCGIICASGLRASREEFVYFILDMRTGPRGSITASQVARVNPSERSVHHDHERVELLTEAWVSQGQRMINNEKRHGGKQCKTIDHGWREILTGARDS